jgi:hypothetical protein
MRSPMHIAARTQGHPRPRASFTKLRACALVPQVTVKYDDETTRAWPKELVLEVRGWTPYSLRALSPQRDVGC